MAGAVATDCHCNYLKFVRFVSLQGVFHFPQKIILILENIFVMTVGSDDWKQYCNCRCLRGVITMTISDEQSSVLLLGKTSRKKMFSFWHWVGGWGGVIKVIL